MPQPKAQNADCPSIHLNDIDCTISCHRPSIRSTGAIADTRAGKLLNIPPPMKFDRKAKKKIQAAPAPSKSIEYVHADWEGVYRSHRQYVQSLVLESDMLSANATADPDTW
eukprot:CAMPEP_0172172324 /NCGR_PEP_ID=MMETSP1050-20130122/12379_1 /TAXON_ID=233186 /ORGANISM="Cryptomonas curvata, Strain CCAP979/52" /LENGTH=110 /DNA_ID=CAMNT_0012843843 /DNA_START=79 /DNA_END=408 /DNA_ORIENTATION=-